MEPILKERTEPIASTIKHTQLDKPVAVEDAPRTAETAQTIAHLPRLDRVVQFTRARLDPPRIDRATAETVLDRFHLALVAPPKNLPFGRRNRTVLVETSAGRMVLKLYRSGWQRSSIVHEHSILQRLEQLSFPAPRLVSTPGGETIFSQENRHYAIFDFIPGTNFASSYVWPAHRHKLLAVAGRRLAHLHQQLADFVPSGRHHLGFDSYESDRDDVEWYLQKLACLPQKSLEIADPEARTTALRMAAMSERIRDQLFELNRRFQEAPPQRAIIHGDYGVHNILFQRDGTAVVHDFELARQEWRASDLVIALSRLNLAHGRIFLGAYQSVNPLADEERQLFPLVWQAFMLQGAIRSWDNYFALGGARRLQKACDRVQQADWALENRDALLAR